MFCLVSVSIMIFFSCEALADQKIYGAGDDGLKVTKAEVDVFKKVMVPSHIIPTESELLRVFLQQKLFALEGEKQGLADEEDRKIELELLREKVLANAYAEKYLARQLHVGNEVMESYYLSHIEEFIRPRQLHLFRLVVQDKNLAEDLYAKAKKAPASFGDLVNANSIDPRTKWKGGDMGMVSFENLTPEVRKALEGIAKGGVTSPLEIHGFYYIFWIKDLKPETTIKLDAIRDKLYKKLTAQRRRDLCQAEAERLSLKYNFKWQTDAMITQPSSRQSQ